MPDSVEIRLPEQCGVGVKRVTDRCSESDAQSEFSMVAIVGLAGLTDACSVGGADIIGYR